MEVIINGQTVIVEDAKITEALSAGKLEVTEEELILFKKDEYETRTKNIADAEYKKGKTAEREMLAKEIKEKYGMNDVEGKDFDKIFDAYKGIVLKDAKIEPAERLKKYEQDILTLQSTLKTIESEKETIINDYKNREKNNKLESELFTLIPDNIVNDKFTRKDLIALFKANGYSTDVDESGKTVVLFNNELYKNEKTLEPLAVKDVLNKFIEDKGFIKKDSTPNPGDKTPKGATALDKFYKEMEGKPQHEVLREMQKRIADKTLIV